MKAIKTTIANTGFSLYLKALTFALLSASAVIFLLMCIEALLLLVAGKIPYGILPFVGIAISAIGAFVGGYVASGIIRSRGLMWGSVCGAIVFIVCFSVGMASTKDTLSYLTLLRLGVLWISGALGGIKGVNKKEKSRI